MKRKSHIIQTILFLVITLLLFSSCANYEAVDTCLEGYTYGFFGGLWHGVIAPIDLVIMFFRDDVTVFAQNNNGMWYSFGFIIGSGGWGLLGGASSKRKKNRDYK